jgi:hypothetical protein
MFAALVKNKQAPHTFVNDLESFFYVILWLVLMYSASSLMTEERTAFMQQVLDPEQYNDTGGSTKTDFLQACSTLWDITFKNPNRPSLQKLLIDLATLFSVRYEAAPDQTAWDLLIGLPEAKQEQLPARQYEIHLEHLKSHQCVIQLISKATQDVSKWPGDNCAIRQSLLPPPKETKKRKTTKTDWDKLDRPVKKLQMLLSDSE